MEQTSNDKYSHKRKEKYGTCPNCNKYNTNHSWCQLCDSWQLTQGWTSGNETLDELIKGTQLNATGYDNHDYLQWIPYKDLKDIETIGEGGFATIYKATWINGLKYIDYHNEYKKSSKDRVVALKKLHNSQKISNEFLNEVNYLMKTTIVIIFLKKIIIINVIKYIYSSKIMIN
jgi:serine/threonine protein kinase